MKILGIDSATTTGWSILEDSKLINYGALTPNPKLIKLLPEKLDFYYQNIQCLISTYNPDYVALEDTLLACSGPKVLKYLSRLNGVVIYSIYSSGISSDKIFLYDPNHWKKNSVPGLNGHAKKWEIQLAVCDFFKVEYDKEYNNIISRLKVKVDEQKKKISDLNKKFKVSKKISFKKKSKIEKDNLKILVKENNKELVKLCKTIYDKTGISQDMADAICIAVCAEKKINGKD